ncbi:MAG: GHKL domain-containing protein [Tepidibacter sp.]|nr:GHKL domain-containing protein [Tepidibacter sp.]
MVIKSIKLGVYYIVLELGLYHIYEKEQFEFFISYILTFWIFQIADICTGFLLYKNISISNILNENVFVGIVLPQLIIIFIAIILSTFISKVDNINKSIYIKEKNLLWGYTNTIIIIYMILIHYYNSTSNTQSIIIISICVLCFFLSMSYFIFIILNKLYVEKNERKHIEMYNQIIEESLDNMNLFKHDYKNIMLSIGGFLYSNDIEGLKKYFYKNITNNEYIDNKNLYRLTNIQNSPIKGLLYGKISSAISKKINLNISIENSIENFILKDIDMCRILGILIDNAIEASIKSEKKVLNVGMSNDDSEIYIIISNSFKDKPIMHNIFEKGYSTKGSNRGLGLSIVRELNKTKYPNMSISTKIKEELFHMEIIIKK